MSALTQRVPGAEGTGILPAVSGDKGLPKLLRIVARELRERFRRRWTWLRIARAAEGSIAWGVELEVGAGSTLELGAASSIGHGTVLAMKPGRHGPGRVRIGNRTWIGQYNNLRTDGPELRIGDDCMISQFVSLIAGQHAHQRRDLPINEQGSADPAGLTIGDDVWIGAGAVVLPGVTIGTGAVVASGAVVTKDVGGYTVVAGVPARVVGERS
jgi:acetyltransferase-like isoleucine patch superfamily enzyme